MTADKTLTPESRALLNALEAYHLRGSVSLAARLHGIEAAVEKRVRAESELNDDEWTLVLAALAVAQGVPMRGNGEYAEMWPDDPTDLAIVRSIERKASAALTTTPTEPREDQ